MPDTRHPPETVFSLRLLAPALADWAPPEQPFDPEGAWTLRYRLFSTQGKKPWGGAGNLEITREPGPDRLRLEFRHQIHARGRHHFETRVDAILPPNTLPADSWSWTLRSRLIRAGETVPETLAEKSGRVENGSIHLRTGPTRRVHSAPPPVLAPWLLFELLQKPSTTDTLDLTFTSLYEFEEPQPDQSVRFRKRTTLALPAADGEPVPFDVFEHVGAGQVPRVYWRDNAGRIAIAASGIMATLLDTQESIPS